MTKPMQATEKFVSLPVPIIVPTVTRVNTCQYARKQERERNAMQRFATFFSVVGRISGATLTSVFTGQNFVVGRQLQVSTF
jgi:hypothetical protein